MILIEPPQVLHLQIYLQTTSEIVIITKNCARPIELRYAQYIVYLDVTQDTSIVSIGRVFRCSLQLKPQFLAVGYIANDNEDKALAILFTDKKHVPVIIKVNGVLRLYIFFSNKGLRVKLKTSFQ